jgi:hypothetical protein
MKKLIHLNTTVQSTRTITNQNTYSFDTKLNIKRTILYIKSNTLYISKESEQDNPNQDFLIVNLNTSKSYITQKQEYHLPPNTKQVYKVLAFLGIQVFLKMCFAVVVTEAELKLDLNGRQVFQIKKVIDIKFKESILQKTRNQSECETLKNSVEKIGKEMEFDEKKELNEVLKVLKDKDSNFLSLNKLKSGPEVLIKAFYKTIDCFVRLQKERFFEENYKSGLESCKRTTFLLS